VPRTFTSTPSTSKIRIFGCLRGAWLFRLTRFLRKEDFLGTFPGSFARHSRKQKVSPFPRHRVKPARFRTSYVARKSGALLHWWERLTPVCLRDLLFLCYF